MKAQISPSQKELLKGQSSKLATKHNCSKEYVLKIINGQRKISSKLSVAIYDDLNTLIEFLTVPA